MKATFAVVRSKGPAWIAGQPMRAQEGWDEHAEFMDTLFNEGFVILGGPLGEDGEVLLTVEAEDEGEVRNTLQRDPWSEAGILVVSSVRRWNILLDFRKR
jgi:uncharacterized protein YciI